MGHIADLPNELLLIILRPLKGKELFRVACMCKALSDVAIPLLYVHIELGTRCEPILALAERLLFNTDLAESVQSLTCDVTSDANWDLHLPQHFVDKYKERFSFVYGRDGEEWGVADLLRFHQTDAILGVVLHCCPNLSSLELTAACRSYECLLFPPTHWPWRKLENVTFNHHQYHGARPEQACEFLAQFVKAVPSDYRLKSLWVRNVACSGLEPFTSFRTPVQVRRLALNKIEYDIHHKGWVTIREMLEICQNLETFVLAFNFRQEVSCFESSTLLHELMHLHQHSLKIIYISLGTIEKLHEYEYPRGSYNAPPLRRSVFNFQKFRVLERLVVPAPYFLGPSFFLKPDMLIPANIDANANSLEFGKNLPEPSPGFGIDFEDALVKSLPSRLYELILTGEASRYEDQALEYAIRGLKNAKKEGQFPNLTATIKKSIVE